MDDSLGARVARLGDLDGDSVADYAASATYAYSESGLVNIYSGASGAVLHSYAGWASYVGLGESIASLGDVTGDGVPDFAISAVGDSPFQPDAVRLYSGADYSMLFEWTIPSAVDGFGTTIKSVGDADGDGYNDLGIWAAYDIVPGPGGHHGKLYVYSSATHLLLWSRLGSYMDGPALGNFASIGDINNDGYGDLAIGDPSRKNLADEVVGQVLLMSAYDGSTIRSWQGANDDVFGQSIDSIEDVDGDGLQDVVMRSSYTPSGGTALHGLWVFSSANGTELVHLGGLTEPISSQLFKCIPDVTGDAIPDLLVKLTVFPSRLQVRSTRDMQVVYEITAQGQGEQTFAKADYLGDINGDGIGDWVAGAPLQGFPLIYQGHVYVVSGADPVGTAYCTQAVPNSSGRIGWLTAAGSDELANDWLSLRVQGLPLNSFGLFLCSQTQAYVPHPGGSDGNLCLGGALGRFNLAEQIQGWTSVPEAALGVSWLALPQPAGPVMATVGDHWNFQMWYRDIGGTSNFTNGLKVIVE